ncbi:hypothetical protein [Natronosalvus caseinilyticus]|uniref:hypothetical protein n=1 Tax=Natronosalvus caseinilyticus TaxID=2953747 RepID=UPI0028A87DC1|nr:hypothetical protein [Natronosalvus caseinilyticus]
MVNPDPDPDVDLYDIEVSEEQDEFFQRIRQRHAELFDAPESQEWLHSSSDRWLSDIQMPPESVEAVIQVIVEVWEVDGLDARDEEYATLLEAIEIEPVADDLVPDALKE